jgi:hypothetical protein
LLQRRVVDFSSERSLAKASKAIAEHYGFELPCSAVAKITAEAGFAAREFNSTVDGDGERSPLLVVELDGSMVPIVEYNEATEEQKSKGLTRDRNCHWREFRLCTASRPDEASTYYGVVRGDPFEAGCMMYETCLKKGMDETTHIHGVADGAPWIAEQYEDQFGANHTLLIDFYHVSEYLGVASGELNSNLLGQQSPSQWLTEAKQKLKQGKAPEVIGELARHADANPKSAAIHTAHQYLSNREKHLDYAKALEQDLPIGSGEVESGHRSVLQARLKKPGAWWKLENAQNMAHLKVMQANDYWDAFWQKAAA